MTDRVSNNKMKKIITDGYEEEEKKTADVSVSHKSAAACWISPVSMSQRAQSCCQHCLLSELQNKSRGGKMWRNRADNKSGGRLRHTHHKPPTQGLIFSGICLEFRCLYFRARTHTHTHTHTHTPPPPIKITFQVCSPHQPSPVRRHSFFPFFYFKERWHLHCSPIHHCLCLWSVWQSSLLLPGDD